MRTDYELEVKIDYKNCVLVETLDVSEPTGQTSTLYDIQLIVSHHLVQLCYLLCARSI